MPPRHPHDPFTNAPLRPTTGNPSFRAQTSQSSLRSHASNASNASSRPRQPRDLFAPTLSRRPTSRTTPRVEDEVLADADSDEEWEAQAQRQQLRARQLRQGSPDKVQRHGRSRAVARHEQEEVFDIVYRQPDGTYMLDASEAGTAVSALQLYHSAEFAGEEEEGNDAATNAHYASIAREYFTSGKAMGKRGRSGGVVDTEAEELLPEMMAHLRHQATRRLEEERWLYEPTTSGAF
ncbi:hypothetical protein LTR62_007025 [Meristemomyces frigidus]|uniref:Uncharacterized protein n=1 Tax=Meristemomyces frigidus TaxID=1508187 RepID=A0AAN7TMV1_9PEZI|nr:hypothetical protein LTR62_007025 [Meristemomyces frigidus]